MNQNIVVFTGAGISAESGIKTFRGSDGLWENFRIEEVATPDAWKRNKKLVLEFYNQRRKQVIDAKPNKAHCFLAELENHHNVQIITQNIDDLHERAGSKNVLHLHGEIMKSQSSLNETIIYSISDGKIELGEKCELGSQLRPHVVWFGEPVPKMNDALNISNKADVFIVIGTSLKVYPASSLLFALRDSCKIIVIDPNAKELALPNKKVTLFPFKASESINHLKTELNLQ